MVKQLVSAAAVPPPASGAYSPALHAGGFLFLAGRTGQGETIEEQTASALESASELLAAGGCSFADVVSCLVHLSDLSLFERYNAVYVRYFPEPRPARTTVGAALLDGALVEVTLVARVPG